MTSVCRLFLIAGLSLALGACSIFGGGDDEARELEPRTTAIGVNGYLWQATLDTLSFMPITAADPAAAVIVTDWFSDPEVLNERVKLTVRFLSEALRSDGLKVTVVRQVRRDDTWVAAPVQAATALQIEEAILTRARTLRIDTNT
ncbi:DUF3576 domain-containing protein [Eilatimonas milleporae]|uniref:Uncharacterized protein DUF3576 n=1 Tax=Eilatimonas milleporae TaxID=911205 RepID=A0A3M0BWK7_9PROT|nr:DUF3576 domain-containing protein [Eilatimonas milleporae]RMB01808.1 uncharacterized protein DUF3576 [Eilatimonas milleporae]